LLLAALFLTQAWLLMAKFRLHSCCCRCFCWWCPIPRLLLCWLFWALAHSKMHSLAICLLLLLLLSVLLLLLLLLRNLHALLLLQHSLLYQLLPPLQ
jgi:hypothetical protein